MNDQEILDALKSRLSGETREESPTTLRQVEHVSGGGGITLRAEATVSSERLRGGDRTIELATTLLDMACHLLLQVRAATEGKPTPEGEPLDLVADFAMRSLVSVPAEATVGEAIQRAEVAAEQSRQLAIAHEQNSARLQRVVDDIERAQQALDRVEARVSDRLRDVENEASTATRDIADLRGRVEDLERNAG